MNRTEFINKIKAGCPQVDYRQIDAYFSNQQIDLTEEKAEEYIRLFNQHAEEAAGAPQKGAAGLDQWTMAAGLGTAHPTKTGRDRPSL
ncbi:MAG: hypothetical protein ACFB8W_02820 [Elainellaceae cyanobacterium]